MVELNHVTSYPITFNQKELVVQSDYLYTHYGSNCYVDGDKSKYSVLLQFPPEPTIQIVSALRVVALYGLKVEKSNKKHGTKKSILRESFLNNIIRPPFVNE